MTQSANNAAQVARFTEAARAFTPVRASRYAKLLPFKDGITELRQKGASYRLIRELLTTIDVSVTVDTIGRFVRELIEQRPPARPNHRKTPVRPLSEPPRSSALPTPGKPRLPFTVAPPTESKPETLQSPQPPANVEPTEHSRGRGPRIADPSTV